MTAEDRDLSAAQERLESKQRAEADRKARGEPPPTLEPRRLRVIGESGREASTAPAAPEPALAPDGDRSDPYATLVEPGLYAVAFRGANLLEPYKGRRVWFIDWTIVSPGKGFGLPILGFASRVKKDQRHSPSLALVQLYVAATGRRPPGDLYRRKPDDFLRCALFEARVRTVTRDRRHRDRAPALNYSRVDELVRRLSELPGSEP